MVAGEKRLQGFDSETAKKVAWVGDQGFAAKTARARQIAVSRLG